MRVQHINIAYASWASNAGGGWVGRGVEVMTGINPVACVCSVVSALLIGFGAHSLLICRSKNVGAERLLL